MIIHIKVEAEKFTSRDGTHPDDQEYLTQIKQDIEAIMIARGFVKRKVEVTFLEGGRRL